MNANQTVSFSLASVFYSLLLALLLLAPSGTNAQQLETPFTSPNEVTLNIPGNTIAYSYFSNRMLVRLDQETNRLEFRIPLSSFTPANTGSPQILLHELLLAGSYPEMVILLEAPLDLLLSDNRQPQTRRLRGILICQGVSRDIETDMYVIPLPNQFTMSTTFQFNLWAPNITLPQTYASMVQGHAELVFQNARWINPQDSSR